MTKLLERQGDLATEIDAVDGWEIDRAPTLPPTRYACLPGTAGGQSLRW